ncbi:ribonuclease R [Zongyangia hominis]|uniref:Ribonuclease R n=1 Tax=Zongyangia hominis TaxID=2763677 RepID=A0A926IBF7_9FIRM|nr:ribonuclease R [Zongyangia hominis]MBC8570060.1 ribonuclease R [Zongyangia hominis]
MVKIAEQENFDEKILGIVAKGKRNPVGVEELSRKLKVAKGDQDAFEKRLTRLVEAGELYYKRRGFVLPKNEGLTAAEIVRVNSTYGFARPVGADGDLFIPGRGLMGSLPGDMVLLKTYPSRKEGSLGEGEVVSIAKAAACRFTGVVSRNQDFFEVVPDKMLGFPVRLVSGKANRYKEGDKVLCEIVSRGPRHYNHKARVIEVFGSSLKADNCAQSLIRLSDVNVDFPAVVSEAAEHINASGIHPKERENRLDLREEVIFTIDSADSKDLDDAVSVKKTAEGWELGVHIADVSYYVHPQSPLDNEAYERGTSIYYADRVIPMLPKALSNGICSLNEGEDRLAFSCLMKLDPTGTLISYDFQKTLIRSKVKGVYSEINAILAGEASPEIMEKYSAVMESIHLIDELCDLRLQKKRERGSLELVTCESKIILDENRDVKEIVPRGTGRSENIIEELMLLANESAATFALDKHLPFCFRVHEPPSPEKLQNLSELLGAIGQDKRGIQPGVSSLRLDEILQKVRGTKYQMIVNSQMLRTMSKAKYSEKNIGHFGLVLQNYAHFTSPIRRYPDLFIHRVMSAYLAGSGVERLSKRFGKVAGPTANQSSEREVVAMTIERDCEDCYKAEYILHHLGEEMEGVVSSTTNFGIYVMLPNTVEGLVRAQTLGDSFQYDGRMEYKDMLSPRRYRIGDTVTVKVMGADVSAGKIDFEFV